ncbi:MAG TPA: nucleotidyltransferase family protein, partial [Vicinamibacteria bacterium]
MIAAILLAAGESRRMGFPKALLPYPLEGGGETTFLERLLHVFARSKAAPLLVVLGHDAARIRAAVDWGGSEARIVLNERYREGMLSSIRAGIEAVEAMNDPRIEGALVHPVDTPSVSAEVVDRVIETFEQTRRPIVLPLHGGRRGHPVLFARALFDEIRRAPDGVGARRVVWDHERDLLEVEVPDPGIHRDVDTPEDYRRFREGTE